MSKKSYPWRSALSFGLGLSLMAGCAGGKPAAPGTTPNANSTPGANASVAASGTPVAAIPPGKIDVTEVKAGDGAAVDGAGGVQAEVKVWTDKFEGTPLGGPMVKVLLVPDTPSLPGLLTMIKGMKKGGVSRATLTGQDLFGEVPQGAPFAPDQPLYVELKVADVYPKEPFDIKTTKPGTGDKAAAKGDVLQVHYVGKLKGFDSKEVFDSSRVRTSPFTLTLGKGQVIAGWEKGLEGMKKGEVRQISIPHYLAYGDKAQGEKIPAKSRLFFEVELMDFVSPGELVQKTKKPGDGQAIEAGQTGNFHYTGWTDGFDGKAKFDSSKDRNAPIKVQLGAGQVIQGWDQGLVGMKPGEVRLLEIPYNLAYGEAGKGPIPPYATLFFEVEYVGPADPTATPAPAP